jgi:hypothetical protein
MIDLDCPSPWFCACAMDAGMGERRKRVSWFSMGGKSVAAAVAGLLAPPSLASPGPDPPTIPDEACSVAKVDAIGQNQERYTI